MGADFNLVYFHLAVAIWALVTAIFTFVLLWRLKKVAVSPLFHVFVVPIFVVTILFVTMIFKAPIVAILEDEMEDRHGNRQPIFAGVLYFWYAISSAVAWLFVFSRRKKTCPNGAGL